jgi:hypothetical protein
MISHRERHGWLGNKGGAFSPKRGRAVKATSPPKAGGTPGSRPHPRRRQGGTPGSRPHPAEGRGHPWVKAPPPPKAGGHPRVKAPSPPKGGSTPGSRLFFMRRRSTPHANNSPANRQPRSAVGYGERGGKLFVPQITERSDQTRWTRAAQLCAPWVFLYVPCPGLRSSSRDLACTPLGSRVE